MLLCNVTTGSHAQNNPQKISDKLYPLYIEAFNNRKNDSCLPVIENLRKKSIAIGDRNGEVAALALRLYHEYEKSDNLPAIDKAMKPLMEKSKQYGLKLYYYNAISIKISYYARENKFIEALMYMNKENEIAEKSHDKEGLCMLMRMQGIVQQYRGELSQAIGCFENAIDYYKRNNYKRYISREYLSICDCYRLMCKYEDMTSTAKKALEYCLTQQDSCDAVTYLCYGQFMQNKDKEFIKGYNYLESHKGKLSNTFIIMNDVVSACKAMCDNNDQSAIKAINKVEERSRDEGCRLYIAYYKRKGNYLKSFEYIKELMQLRYEDNDKVFGYDHNSIQNIFANQKIESERQRIVRENTALELNNANMELHNASLELDKRRDALQLAVNAGRMDSLTNSCQELAEKQLTDSVEAQRLMHAAKEKRRLTERIVLWILLAAGIIIMVMTFIYSIRKHTVAKRLRIANGELDENIYKLNEAKGKALESDRMKTMFIQNMSHEIRTPLNAIVGFSNVMTEMGDSFSTEEKVKMAKTISDNSELLITLLNDILDMTHMKSGNISVKMGKVNVNAVCRQVLETVRHRLAKGVELKFNTTLPDSYTATTDSHRICQVLINMLTNAEKNTTSGSITLECSLDSHPGMITFTVTDTGIGVPKAMHEEIFKRFRKLDDFKPGTGLGLNICRNIAVKLGGEINIDPDYSNGAKFWFTIPAE